jgi:hypothetical protein
MPIWVLVDKILCSVWLCVYCVASWCVLICRLIRTRTPYSIQTTTCNSEGTDQLPKDGTQLLKHGAAKWNNKLIRIDAFVGYSWTLTHVHTVFQHALCTDPLDVPNMLVTSQIVNLLFWGQIPILCITFDLCCLSMDIPSTGHHQQRSHYFWTYKTTQTLVYFSLCAIQKSLAMFWKFA